MVLVAEFETRMSSKGQVVIAKKVREELGLRPNQKFVGKLRGGRIVLKPVPELARLRGSLRHVAKRKSVSEISRWIDEGWE